MSYDKPIDWNNYDRTGAGSLDKSVPVEHPARREPLRSDRVLSQGSLHKTTFEYLLPTEGQTVLMSNARWATKLYASTIDNLVPEGPDKTYILRRIRETAMWINVAITRHPNGSPRLPTDGIVDHM